ncbi:MAG TPA: putative toxin-antitoxin system toxin component, PIN family [Candidatus Desulfobacillus sp.]|nr:putative toxin-antitoxin system toxin component, PIN family [Candidatus Desulfobacillus sp.]
MIRLVLDTNVVLDLLHFDDAAARPLRRALQDGRAACFADDACRAELARVLGYPRLGIAAEAGRRILAGYDAVAQPCAKGAGGGLPTCRDPDDVKFLELARAAQADFLITKDKALLALSRECARLGFRIVTPEAAAAVLDPA